MLANEFRPNKFGDVVGQRHIVKNLREQSKKNKWFNTYVFAGQYGSGKTTLARIMAKAVNCENKGADGEPCCECNACRNFLTSPDYYEIDGASNNGVEKIRELIDNVSYAPVSGKYKVYVIDEVHMLSAGAFNALLKTLEEPPAYAIFILATTEINKIPPTIISRSAVYNFQQISVDDIYERLFACESKGIKLTDGAAELIAKQAKGSMRNAWGILEQAAADGNIVSSEKVRELLLLNEDEIIFDLISAISEGNIKKIAGTIDGFVKTGNSIVSLVGDMEDAVGEAILKKAGTDIKGDETHLNLLQAFCGNTSISYLCALADGLMSIKQELKKGATKESAILRFIRMSESLGNADCSLKLRIDVLEKEVAALKCVANGTEVFVQKNEQSVVQEYSVMEMPENTVPENAEGMQEESEGSEIPDAQEGGKTDPVKIENTEEEDMFDFLNGFDFMESVMPLAESEPVKEVYDEHEADKKVPDEPEYVRESTAIQADAEKNDGGQDESSYFEYLASSAVNHGSIESELADETEHFTGASGEEEAFEFSDDLFSPEMLSENLPDIDGNIPDALAEDMKEPENEIADMSQQMNNTENADADEIKLLEVMNSDAVLYEAVNSCSRRKQQNGGIVIETPFKAVKKIIDKYIEVYGLKNISVDVNIA